MARSMAATLPPTVRRPALAAPCLRGIPMGVDDFDGRGHFAKRTPLHRFRCVDCSYGASRSTAPERCPMCGGSAWEFEDWRPFSALVGDLAQRQSSAKGSTPL